MIKMMYMMMLVITMRLAGTQCNLIHLQHGNLDVMTLGNGTGRRSTARECNAVTINFIVNELEN